MNDQSILIFLMVFTRVGALTIIAPIYGGKMISLRLRVGIAAAISFVIFPLAAGNNLSIENLSNLVPVFLGELVIGLVFGLMGMTLIFAASLAGKIIASMCGAHFSELVDSVSQSASPPITRLFQSIALLVFVVIGGHRKVLDGLLSSFKAAPVGNDHLAIDFTTLATSLIAQGFELGIRVAVPILFSICTMMILIAAATRANPAFGAVHQTLTVNRITALVMMFVTAGGLVWFSDSFLDSAIDFLNSQLVAAKSE